MIYQPSDDSYLMQEEVKDYLSHKNKDKNIKILDMGSGSGIQAQTCIELGFNNVLCVDINPWAVNHLEKRGFNVIGSDLFSNIPKEEKFNLIIFNPPYLPLDKREPQDSQVSTTAGKKGYEIIVRFLKEAKEYLNKDGKILLLFSSLSKQRVILKELKKLGYNSRQLSNKKLDFEELFVFVIG